MDNITNQQVNEELDRLNELIYSMKEFEGHFELFYDHGYTGFKWVGADLDVRTISPAGDRTPRQLYSLIYGIRIGVNMSKRRINK